MSERPYPVHYFMGNPIWYEPDEDGQMVYRDQHGTVYEKDGHGNLKHKDPPPPRSRSQKRGVERTLPLRPHP